MGRQVARGLLGGIEAVRSSPRCNEADLSGMQMGIDGNLTTQQVSDHIQYTRRQVKMQRISKQCNNMDESRSTGRGDNHSACNDMHASAMPSHAETQLNIDEASSLELHKQVGTPQRKRVRWTKKMEAALHLGDSIVL